MTDAITPGIRDYVASRRIAEDYDRYFRHNELFRFDTQVLDRWLRAPGRLLDLGCGTGRHVRHFASRGFEVTGVDLSEHMLAAARRKALAQGCSAQFVQGDITRLDGLGLGRFDYAICMFSTLGMIYGAANRLAFLRSVREHLEPGGLFASHVHNRWHNLYYADGREYLWDAFRRRLRRESEAFQKDVDGYRGIRGISLYVFTDREVRRLMRQAGLELDELLYLNRRRNGVLRGILRGVRANGFLLSARKPAGDA